MIHRRDIQNLLRQDLPKGRDYNQLRLLLLQPGDPCLTADPLRLVYFQAL